MADMFPLIRSPWRCIRTVIITILFLAIAFQLYMIFKPSGHHERSKANHRSHKSAHMTTNNTFSSKMNLERSHSNVNPFMNWMHKARATVKPNTPSVNNIKYHQNPVLRVKSEHTRKGRVKALMMQMRRPHPKNLRRFKKKKHRKMARNPRSIHSKVVGNSLTAVKPPIIRSSGKATFRANLGPEEIKAVRRIPLHKVHKDRLSDKEEVELFQLINKSEKETAYRKRFPKVLDPLPNVCNGTAPFLVVLVLSMPSHRETRRLIRRTWGSVVSAQHPRVDGVPRAWPHTGPLRSNVSLLFVIGQEVTNGNSHSVSTKDLEQEQATEKDLLLVNSNESYRKLTDKMAAALTWVHRCCPGVKFLLKADEDTFVNLPLLVNFLSYYAGAGKHTLSTSVLGHLYLSPEVVRRGAWRVSLAQYPPHRYPSHASGASYVISGDALPRLLEVMGSFPAPFPIEDAFITGISAKLGGVSRIHSTALARRNTLRGRTKIDACELLLDRMSVTDMTVGDLEKLWLAVKAGVCRKRGDRSNIIIR